MSIEQIIAELNHKIMQEYGIENAVHTLIMNHEAFDRVVIELFRKTRDRYSFQPSSMSDLHIYGVRVLARPRKVSE